MNDTAAPAPPTLPELVTLLANQQPHLERLQDELEQAKQRNVELHSLVGAAAIATGERKPHPAVTVQFKCKGRIGYTPVKIKEDLSPWCSESNTNGAEQVEWCTDCKLVPAKCGGTVGVSCARYPLILEEKRAMSETKTTNRPSLEQVLTILEMKEEASALYDEIDARVAEMAKKFGAGRFDYELEGVPDTDFVNAQRDKGQFLKFEITDNIAELASGATVWKSTAFKPLSFSSRALKRRPKSLCR